MSWMPHQNYAPPPQGYHAPTGPYQQPYQQQYPPGPPAPYGTPSPQPPHAPHAPPGPAGPAMNQHYFAQNQSYPPPPGPQHSYPPQGPPYGGQQGFAPPANPYPPPHQAQNQFAQQQSYQTQPPIPAGPYGGIGGPGHHSDPNRDAETLRKAMQGFGTNEKELISVVSAVPNPQYMAQVGAAFQGMYHRSLEKDISSETSGYFREALQALVRGPLKQDVHVLHAAIRGGGTDENVLNDVLLGRSSADMNALKQEYYNAYRTHLSADVKNDLSFKTRELFEFVTESKREDENAPVYPQMVDQEVRRLHEAMEKQSIGKDQSMVSRIFAHHSDGQLRAIAQAFQRTYQRSLSSVVRKQFSGHMQKALLRILSLAEDRAKADAENLEEAMAGMGTKDRYLVNRLTRIFWDKQHLHQVKGAYRHFFHRELATRISGETSRYYRDLLVALCGQ